MKTILDICLASAGWTMTLVKLRALAPGTKPEK